MTLVLPLRKLADEPGPVDRTLHLDASPLLEPWTARVRDAGEAVLLVDATGRLAAVSRAAGELLGLAPAEVLGARLVELLEVVDFGATPVPVADPALQLAPLRALVTGRLQRGLARLRTPGGLRSYDVVGVPLAASVGALAFVAPV